MRALKFAVTQDQLLHGLQESARRTMRPLTSAQLDEQMIALLEGKSPCCSAALDESDVEPRGAKRGQGPRYCSRCGEEVFRV